MAKKIPDSKKTERSTTTAKFKRPVRTPNNALMSASQKSALT